MQCGEDDAADIHRKVHLQKEGGCAEGDEVQATHPREGQGEGDREGGGALRLEVLPYTFYLTTPSTLPLLPYPFPFLTTLYNSPLLHHT